MNFFRSIVPQRTINGVVVFICLLWPFYEQNKDAAFYLDSRLLVNWGSNPFPGVILSISAFLRLFFKKTAFYSIEFEAGAV
jgi:hypothetical protein